MRMGGWAVAAGLLVLAGTAQAQDKTWGGQFQAGIPTPLDALDDAAGSAFGWGVGARWAPPTKNFALRFDIENSRFNIDNQQLLNTVAWQADDGFARIWDFQLNAEFGMRNDAKFRVYGIAGVGYGNVYGAVTNGTVATGCWWDPWWGYICGSGVVDEILADGDRWDFSGRAGAGASYKFGSWGPTLFVEGRYSLIFTGGDERPQGSTGGAGNETKNTVWLPIMIGLRF